VSWESVRINPTSTVRKVNVPPSPPPPGPMSPPPSPMLVAGNSDALQARGLQKPLVAVRHLAIEGRNGYTQRGDLAGGLLSNI
jgi:hypothetical protein